MKLGALFLIPLILKIVGVEAGVINNEQREKAPSFFERVKNKLLILSGTKWCGKGNVAKSYYDLGVYKKVDDCCRTHDQCNVTIGGFSKNYGYWNIRPYVISHCSCDIALKNCLKGVRTSFAVRVFKLFFYFFRTPCFTTAFKEREYCVKRNWWNWWKCADSKTITEEVAKLVYL